MLYLAGWPNTMSDGNVTGFLLIPSVVIPLPPIRIRFFISCNSLKMVNRMNLMKWKLAYTYLKLSFSFVVVQPDLAAALFRAMKSLITLYLASFSDPFTAPDQCCNASETPPSIFSYVVP
jgi:hypothetical protein